MTTTKIITRSLRLAYPKYATNTSRNISLWTSDNVVKSPYKDLEIPSKLVSEQIWENLDRWADKTAVICGITKRSFTYHELYKKSRNLAAKFRNRLKVRDGDVICIMIQNAPDFPLAVLGALQAGAEVTTINPIYTPHEVQRQLILSKPKIVIGMPETIPVLKEAMNQIKQELPIIASKGYINNDIPPNTISLEELANDDNVDHSVLKEVNRKLEDIAFLPYSSGTTGLPKGVELTNKNIVANLVQQNLKEIRHYEETTGSHQDATLAVLPFYHIYGLIIVLFHKLSVGVKVVTLPKFQPQTFTTTLKEQRINSLFAAPPLVLFVGSHPEITKEHLAPVKLITCGAAPLPKVDIYRVLDKGTQNLNFIQLYGLTETSPLVTSMPVGGKKYTTAGEALPNTELKIVDSDLNNLGPNKVGELLIRGPQVMKGYRDNPESTKNTITEDGWFKSGDLACIDEDGSVTITDRLKELIKVKGFQVAPAELEAVIREHPDVVDAGVIGIPDAKSGEVPKAFVVLKSGRNVEIENIKSFVAERVAEFKKVREVQFIDSLPKNPSGKLLRRVLKGKKC